MLTQSTLLTADFQPTHLWTYQSGVGYGDTTGYEGEQGGETGYYAEDGQWYEYDGSQQYDGYGQGSDISFMKMHSST